jgi:hypothetical protein
MTAVRALRALLTFQGVYYIVTGLWPFVSLSTFVAMVGPKPDVFQLFVTSALIVAIGAVVLSDAPDPAMGTIRLSVAGAAALLIMEIVFAGSIRPVFALDGAVEFCLIAGVVLFSRIRARPAR